MSEENLPQTSVLIASRDRREMLHRCLLALSEQTEDPADFEVIVIDDGSSDGTAQMVEEMETPFALRLLRREGGGKYRAVNAAIDEARGRTCLILDDDVIASPGLVAGHSTAHRSDPDLLGLGALSQEPPQANDWYAQASARTWAEHYADLERGPASWTDCYGANFSAPRDALRRVGGFATDLTISGDLELGLRLEQAGLHLAFLPDAHGLHVDQKRSRKMLDDARRQAEAHVELARRHPESATGFLEWKGWATPRQLRLRRLLITLRVPPRPLLWAGALVPGEGRKTLCFHVIKKFAFWREVRRLVSRSEWERFTANGGDRTSEALPAAR